LKKKIKTFITIFDKMIKWKN